MSTIERVLLYFSTVVSVVVAIAMIMVWSQMAKVSTHLNNLEPWRAAISSEWRPWVNQTLQTLGDIHGVPVDPPPVPDPPDEFPG